jgi:hypothetical protein
MSDFQSVLGDRIDRLLPCGSSMKPPMAYGWCIVQINGAMRSLQRVTQIDQFSGTLIASIEIPQ